jgi:uncharacterized protein involved in exopolysaccharide biosynthesis
LEYTPSAGSVSTQLIAGTQLLEISVRDTIPKRAQALADEIANQLILQSPTASGETERQTFVSQRLKGLQANIEQTEKEIAEEQAMLKRLTVLVLLQLYHDLNIALFSGTALRASSSF